MNKSGSDMDPSPGEREAPDSSGPKIIRPIPRRPFKLNFASPTPPDDEDEQHPSPRPQISASDLRFLAPHQHATTTPSSGSTPLSHTTSFLNLTKPTLFGIYSPSTVASLTRDEDDDDQDHDHDQDQDDILAPDTTPPDSDNSSDETYARHSLQHTPPPTTTTPHHHLPSPQTRRKTRQLALQLALRAALLFALGVGYGVLVTRLPRHGQPQRLAAYESHYQWRYLAFWGAAGVALGSLLPWVDRFWEEGAASQNAGAVAGLGRGLGSGGGGGVLDQERGQELERRERGRGRVAGEQQSGTGRASGRRNEDGSTKEVPLPPPRVVQDRDKEVDAPITEKPSVSAAPQADWALVVRGIGAFVGIVFAIRRLPWASTMQVSLTLALANPFLWYLIDRSKPGFLLSAAVGLAGTLVVALVDPAVMPSPAPAFGSVTGTGTGSGSEAGAGVASCSPSLSPSLSGGGGGGLGGNITAGTAGCGAQDGGGAFGGLASQETIETSIWLLSVLFCSCVCFGNIGRRLALNSSAAGRGRWGGVR